MDSSPGPWQWTRVVEMYRRGGFSCQLLGNEGLFQDLGNERELLRGTAGPEGFRKQKELLLGTCGSMAEPVSWS